MMPGKLSGKSPAEIDQQQNNQQGGQPQLIAKTARTELFRQDVQPPERMPGIVRYGKTRRQQTP